MGLHVSDPTSEGSVLEDLFPLLDVIALIFLKSTYRPPSRFWCLNDKTIKNLMSFVKCEIEKMSYNYINVIRSSRHM
jgi:hypothetical protein